jgi:NAD(P)-dependent dehydrogenase (short-subunit alcohol dehydrogenase family)
VAQRLAADGFVVVLADIRRDPLTGGEPTDELIRRNGGTCDFVATNVSRRGDCEQVVRLAVERQGSLDVLVNNAVLAGQHSKPLLETQDDDWDAMMGVNLRGPFMLCQIAIRQMLAQPLRGDARDPDPDLLRPRGGSGL